MMHARMPVFKTLDAQNTVKPVTVEVIQMAKGYAAGQPAKYTLLILHASVINSPFPSLRFCAAVRYMPESKEIKPCEEKKIRASMTVHSNRNITGAL